MPEEKTRLARLSAIVTQLQSKSIVTAKAIADRHNVSIRTVYRDIRTLEQSGIPIITEEGKGYSILDGYSLPPIMFTEAEALALITAEQLIGRNNDQSLIQKYSEAITKIKSVLRKSQLKKIEMISSRLQVRKGDDNDSSSKYLIDLQSKIANYEVVNIEYLSLSDYRSNRNVEPFALYTTKGNWILIAFCQNAKDLRAFRIDRIKKLTNTTDKFEPHKTTLEQYLEQCRKKWSSTPDIQLSQTGDTFAETKNNIMQKVTIEPFKLIGISIRTTNENGKAAKEIAELWGKFMSEGILEKIPNKVNPEVYSMYTDYESDHTQPYTAILGCKVSSIGTIPDGMIAKEIQGGLYAKTSANGDLMKGLVVNKWAEIFKLDLDRMYSTDFELFGEKAQDPSKAEVEFYIAIK